MNMLQMLTLNLRCHFQKFIYNEEGEVNIVATVVLIGIAVILAILFKDEITKLLNSLFGTISNNATNAIGGTPT